MIQRRQRSDAARNRAEVLAAARAAFDERGLAADVREIARRAGVGVATVYRHFPAKDDLVQAVLADDLAEWSAVVDRASTAQDGWAGLGLFIEQTVGTMARHRAILDGFTESAAAFEACLAHLRTTLDGMVRRAQEQGTLRTDVSAVDVGLQILALGRIVQLTADSDPPAWRRHVGLVLDGLRA